MHLCSFSLIFPTLPSFYAVPFVYFVPPVGGDTLLLSLFPQRAALLLERYEYLLVGTILENLALLSTSL